MYQNAFTIAAEQATKSGSTATNRRSTRTHHSSVRWSDAKKENSTKSGGKPYCFKCEKDHRLTDCDEFKTLAVGERVQFCMKRRLCFTCFSTRHSSREFERRKACPQPGCNYHHHTLLHDDTPAETKARQHAIKTGSRKRVILGTLSLQVRAEDGRWLTINAFMDEGSDTTLMRSGLATVLKLQGPRQIMVVEGAGGVVNRYPSRALEFQVRNEDGLLFTLKGPTLPTLASPTPVTDWTLEKMRWSHLKDLPLSRSGGRIDLLIGLDHAHLLAVYESRVGQADQPIASKTSRRSDGW